MSLIIVTGSNIGNRVHHLELAKLKLEMHLELIDSSQIYESPPVDYLDQDYFYNQALEFALPETSPQELLLITQSIENDIGRQKVIHKGPRVIDIDIIFWGTQKFSESKLCIPHPAWSHRSFVVLPIKELSAYHMLRNHFKFPVDFDNIASPIQR